MKLRLKAKPVVAPKEETEEELLERRIREAYKAQLEIVEINTMIKSLQDKLIAPKERIKALSDALDTEEHHDDDEFTLTVDDEIQVEVKKKAKKREVVDVAKIKKMLGDATFMKIATVSLGEVDKYLNPEQQLEVLSVERLDRTFKFKDIS